MTAPYVEPKADPKPILIYQDCEFDEDGTIGWPMAVFWAKGHGHDQQEFMRAVFDYCLDEARDFPGFRWEDWPKNKPQEVWQQNVVCRDGIEYRRFTQEPTNSHSPKFPITLWDLDSPTRHGGTKCAVEKCTEPWSVGNFTQVAVSPNVGDEHLVGGTPTVSVYIPLCREHRKAYPEPSYRVRMIPVGATIMLPKPAAAGAS